MDYYTKISKTGFTPSRNFQPSKETGVKEGVGGALIDACQNGGRKEVMVYFTRARSGAQEGHPR